MPTYESEIWIVPGEKFAAVVLLNARGGKPAPDAVDPENILSKALSLFVQKQQTSPQIEPANHAEWQALAGAYPDPYGLLGSVTVSYDAGTAALKVDSVKLNVHGAMKPGLVNEDWTLPNGVGVHFYKNERGIYDRLVSRDGVANRQ